MKVMCLSKESRNTYHINVYFSILVSDLMSRNYPVFKKNDAFIERRRHLRKDTGSIDIRSVYRYDKGVQKWRCRYGFTDTA